MNPYLGKHEIQVHDFLNCWGHTRRNFFEAKELDPDLINPVLVDIQELYVIEEKARKQNLNSDQR